MASDLAARAVQISWWVELAVRSGCLDQRFVSDDRQTIHVHERYENSDAAMAHLVKFAAAGGWSGTPRRGLRPRSG
jgi:hypothetical protein